MALFPLAIVSIHASRPCQRRTDRSARGSRRGDSHAGRGRGRAPARTNGAEGMEAAFELLPDAVFCVCRPAMTLTYVTRRRAPGWVIRARNCWGRASTRFVRRGTRRPGPAARPARRGERTAVLRAWSGGKTARPCRPSGTCRRFPSPAASIGSSWPGTCLPLAADGSAGRPAAQELGRLGHDPLTGLPDRRLFERRVDRALERARSTRTTSSPFVSSTWTASRRSTTGWDTWPATASCARSPAGWSAAPGPATWRPGTGGTSSWCLSMISTARRTRCSWPGGFCGRWKPRCRPAAVPSAFRPASALP